MDCLNLSKDNSVRTFNIHKLIADAFIPNPDNLPCINHKDENRANSVLSNLERCSYLYNNTYGSAKQRRRATFLARRSHVAICQYKRNGELIHTYKGGLAEVNELFNDIFKYIRQCLNKEKPTAGGYVWLFEGENFEHKDRPYYRIPVCQYDLNGALVKRYDGGLEDIKSSTTFNIDDIRGCIKGKSKTSQGFVWLHDGMPFLYKKPSPPNQGRKFEGILPKKHQKYVYLVDEDGGIIEKYSSVSEAGRKHGFARHYFSKTPTINGIKTIRGLHFIVETKENEFIPKGHKGARPDLKGKGSKPVCQYTKEGEFIKEYPSINAAADGIGFPKCAPEIASCCHGNLKTARGYIWRHKGSDAPAPFINNSIREIEQYTIDGTFVATFSSIKEAAVAVGNGKAGSINNNLTGRTKSAFGYIWKYAK